MLDGTQINTDRFTGNESFVKYLVEIGAIKLHGDGRVVTYGRGAPYTLSLDNCRSDDVLHLLVSTFIKKAKSVNLDFDIAFGLPQNGIQFAVNIANTINKECDLVSNDDEITIDSSFKGKSVLIIAETLQEKSSIDLVVKSIRKHGGDPIGCIIAFDLQEVTRTGYNARQNCGTNNWMPVHSLTGLQDLISYLEKSLINKNDDADAIEIQKYIKNLKEHQKECAVQLG